MKVRDQMTVDVICCRATDSLEYAAWRMRERHCSSLPVVDPFGRAIGSLSDRDVCMSALEEHRRLRDIPVWRAMLRTLHVAFPDEPLANAAERMAELGVRRLVVLNEREHPVGILSVSDLARRAAAPGFADDGDVGMDDVNAVLARPYRRDGDAARGTSSKSTPYPVAPALPHVRIADEPALRRVRAAVRARAQKVSGPGKRSLS